MTGNYNAGFTELTAKTAAYTFTIACWYPSVTPERTIHYLPYLIGQAAPEGSAVNKKFPLIMISGGYGGTAYDQCYLAEYLARFGLIVAAISHQQFDRGTMLGCERAWYRAKEIILGIDFLLASNKNIDDTLGIGLVGFSAGAFSALLVAGAQPNFEADESYMPFAEIINQLDFTALTDARISALALFAPALGNLFVKETLQKFTHPVLLLTAEQDEVLKTSDKDYAVSLPNIVKHYTLAQAGHFVFNAVVAPVMRKLVPALCEDRGAKREQLHPIINEATYKFFREKLHG
jgi:predicted dienelactone hydrolase